MDIVTTVPGTIRPTKAEDSSDRFVIELPLLFTRVATGPAGIADVVISKVEISGRRFEVVGSPTIHALRVGDDGDTIYRSVAGDQARQRPVTFRPDGNGNNPLVLVFEVAREEATEARQVLVGPGDVHEIMLSMHIVFGNLATLRFRLRGELSGRTGRVLLDQPERETSPLLTNVNLALLCAVAGILLAWNTWWNGDVYDQDVGLSQKTVAALTGSLLTFIGLSLGRIKSWLATLTDTLSVLKFPELHLNPVLTQGLSTRWFSVGLVGAAIGAGSLVGWNWSFETPQMQGLRLYDTREKVFVENQRIDRAALSEPRRFGWICWRNETSRPADPVLLAYVGQDRKTEDVLIEVEIRSPHALDGPYETLTMTGAEWIDAGASGGEIETVVREILCGPELVESARVVDLVVVPENTGELLHRKYVLSNQRIWEAEDIFGWLREIRNAHLRRKDFDQLFANRDESLASVAQELERRFAEGDYADHRSVVAMTDVLTASRAQLAQIAAPKLEDKALERSIILRALWRATADRRDRPPEPYELKAIVDTVGALLDDHRGWELERVLYELLLELQVQAPGSMASKAHEAAISPWNELRDSNHRYPRLLDYLTAAASSDAIGAPQRRFMAEEWHRLVRWAGPHGDLGDLLNARERARHDSGLDLVTLHRELDELAAWVQLLVAEESAT